MAHYVLNEELKQAVQQVCRQFMSSFQPRPKKPRHVLPGDGGGTAAASSLWAGRVTVPIEAATDENHIGEGQVSAFLGNTGIATVKNWTPQGYGQDFLVWCTTIDSENWVVVGTCYPVFPVEEP